MSDGRARLFVALELPDPIRDALVRWRSRLVAERSGDLSPVAFEALHVTLCFLGWRSEDEIDAIAAACTVVAAESAPSLVLSGALWLPPRRPRVLAVRLEDHGARLARVQASLSAALSAGGWYEPEKRPYLAHVTAARVRATRSRSRTDPGPRPRGVGGDLPDPPPLDFRAERVVVYRSRLMRSGARYEALATVHMSVNRA